MSTRMLPMLELPPAPRAVEQPRPTEALAEFATDDLALPRFHMWTLGCQMNRSDAEQMAGARAWLAAHRAAARALETEHAAQPSDV